MKVKFYGGKMILNVKIKGEFAKTYDCTYLSFKFNRLMIFNGDDESITFSITKVEWFAFG